MWGIVPAAGQGSRMQPLAFSKELLPVGSRAEGDRERPRAVSEYLVERLVLGGASRICFVISPGKSDILEYYGGSVFSADVFYAVQPRAAWIGTNAARTDASSTRTAAIDVRARGNISDWLISARVWGFEGNPR